MEPSHPLHISVQYREYNEDLIFDLFDISLVNLNTGWSLVVSDAYYKLLHISVTSMLIKNAIKFSKQIIFKYETVKYSDTLQMRL